LHAGTKEKVWWECRDGHKWETQVSTRTRKIPSGCPACAEYGFDQTLDAWLYFIEHPKWRLLQIGISNTPDRRIALHERRGWRLLDKMGPMPGGAARRTEHGILVALRANSATVAPHEIAGRFDGYTESWVRLSFPVASLEDLIGLANTSG
jgi:Probable Zinc-ribbon domain